MSVNARNATRRLLRELETWQTESQAMPASDVNSPNRGIERLGLADDGDGDLFHWEAVVNGEGVGSGYDGGLGFCLSTFSSIF